MRSVMLATIVLTLFGMMGATAFLSGILGPIAGCPPTERNEFSRATARETAPPQKTSGSSGFLPGSTAIATGTTVSAQKWAEKMFTAGRSKNFGAVPFGTQLFHRFEITNIYAAPVEVTGLSCGCDCVTATPGKRFLRPGESTTVDVTMDTRSFTGPNTQTVRVAIGPNPKSSCVLKVSAISRTDVAFKPDRMISFGTVTHGQASVRSMDVEYTGTLDWKIEGVIVAKELPFEVTLSELVRRPGKVGYRLTVTLKDDAKGGRIRDYIYLRTNQIEVPSVPVLVAATVQAPPSVR